MEMDEVGEKNEVLPSIYRSDKVRMNIWVRKFIVDGVNDIAREEDMSVSDVVRTALKDYIRRYKSRSKRGVL